jgi:hypothetical protein
LTLSTEFVLAAIGLVSQALATTWWLASRFARIDARLGSIEKHMGIEPPDDGPTPSKVRAISPQTRR